MNDDSVRPGRASLVCVGRGMPAAGGGRAVQWAPASVVCCRTPASTPGGTRVLRGHQERTGGLSLSFGMICHDLGPNFGSLIHFLSSFDGYKGHLNPEFENTDPGRQRMLLLFSAILTAGVMLVTILLPVLVKLCHCIVAVMTRACAEPVPRYECKDSTLETQAQSFSAVE